MTLVYQTLHLLYQYKQLYMHLISWPGLSIFISISEIVDVLTEHYSNDVLLVTCRWYSLARQPQHEQCNEKLTTSSEDPDLVSLRNFDLLYPFSSTLASTLLLLHVESLPDGV